MEPRASRRAILPLPPDVKAQIQSSIAITSLNDVVLELVKNSLDAEATDIRVSLSGSRGACEVEDNGCGIHAADSDPNGGLSQPFHTSKYHRSPSTYGSQGQFLASLAALSLVSIISCHKDEDKERTLILHRSRVIGRQCHTDHGISVRKHTYGTLVAVHDLFGNLPVRVKDRALRGQNKIAQSKDFDELRRRILGVLLGYSTPVSVTVIDNEQAENSNSRFRLSSMDAEGNRPVQRLQKPFDLGRIVSLFSQSHRGLGDEDDHWITVSGRRKNFRARAAICLKPVPTKHLQFISLGQFPVGSQDHHGLIFDEVNRIFKHSTFALQDQTPEVGEAEMTLRARDRRFKQDGLVQKRSRDQSKGPDRYPMFYIRIDCLDDEPVTKAGDDPLKIVPSSRLVEDILELLRPMFWQCLEQYGFQPRRVQQKQHKRTRPRDSGNDAIAKVLYGPESDRDKPEHASQSKHQQSLLGAAKALKRPSKKFADWTRIKSSSKDCLKEMELPHCQLDALTRQQDQWVSTSASDENDLSMSSGTLSDHEDGRLSGSSSKIVGLKENESQISVDGNLQEATSDEIITWKDPTSGKVIFLNSRTGLIIHDRGRPESNRSTDKLTLRPAVAARRSVRLTTTKETGDLPYKSDNTWVDDLLKGWANPVFKETEVPIPSISHAFEENPQSQSGESMYRNFGYNEEATFGRLNRTDLATAKIIGQVDKKFILLSMKTTASPQEHNPEKQLVLIDQHAADERCRVEQLLRELCDPLATETISGPNSRWSKPLGFEISSEEARLFEKDQGFFASWNIHYELRQKRGRNGHGEDRSARTGDPQRPAFSTSTTTTKTTNSTSDHSHALLLIQRLPTAIAERCRLEPRILIDMLRTEIWARYDSGTIATSSSSSSTPFHNSNNTITPSPEDQPNISNEWIYRLPLIPHKLLDMLNSRACRSAIMFNDDLSVDECEALAKRLAKCTFPFLCAHGRRSCVCVGMVGGGGRDEMGREEGTRRGDGGGGGGLGAVEDGEQSREDGFEEAFVKWETTLLN